MRKILLLAASALTAVGIASAASAATFSDSFTAAPSPLWENNSGGWFVTPENSYRAAAPNNNPTAYTLLPFDLRDFTVTVDALALGDGGILLRSDESRANAVYLILGGEGYGNGVRGGGAGNSLYFHTVQGGVFSSNLAEVQNVFTPGSDYRISVDVTGDTYTASVNGRAVSALTTDLFSHGFVGLYDDQPNTTSASGFGTPMSFDNFTVTDNSVAAVPEPTGWAMMIGGVGMIGGALRRKRAAEGPLLYARP